jgi:CRISPR-associated protein Cas1
MNTIYINEQGAYVHKSEEHILVTSEGRKIFEFPLNEVKNIVLVGNVQISTQALTLFILNP